MSVSIGLGQTALTRMSPVPPAFSTAASDSRSPSRETSTSPTRAPSAAKRTGAARPMPPAAPVISATFLSNRGPSKRGAVIVVLRSPRPP